MTVGSVNGRFRRASVADLAEGVHQVEAGAYSRIAGQILGGSRDIHETFAGTQRLPSDLGLVSSGSMTDVIVVGGGMALTDGGEVLSESLNCIQNLTAYRGFDRTEGGAAWETGEPLEVSSLVERIPGRQHVLMKSAWDANYGHWLFDSLARLALLEGMGVHRPLLVVNAQTEQMARVVKDSLNLAGFSSDDIVWHDFAIRRYESLVVLGNLSRHPTTKSQLAVDYLTSLASPLPAGPASRIYLSRNKYSRRRLLNEDLIWPLFERRGFIRIAPEKLTLAEQMSLFKGAEVVAGNLGASFSSLAFSPLGVRILALTTESMEHDFFYDIACVKTGQYVAVQGITRDEEATLSSDFHVEGAKVEHALDLVTGPRS